MEGGRGDVGWVVYDYDYVKKSLRLCLTSCGLREVISFTRAKYPWILKFNLANKDLYRCARLTSSILFYLSFLYLHKNTNNKRKKMCVHTCIHIICMHLWYMYANVFTCRRNGFIQSKVETKEEKKGNGVEGGVMVGALMLLLSSSILLSWLWLRLLLSLL